MLTVYVNAIDIQITVGARASAIAIVGESNSHCMRSGAKVPEKDTVCQAPALCDATTSWAVVTCLPSMDRTNCAFPDQASSDRLTSDYRRGGRVAVEPPTVKLLVALLYIAAVVPLRGRAVERHELTYRLRSAGRRSAIPIVNELDLDRVRSG